MAAKEAPACAGDDMIPMLPIKVLRAFPRAVQWVEAQERRILRFGFPLTPEQIRDAIAAGVAKPDRVRLLPVPLIPGPSDPLLEELGRKFRLTMTDKTAGLTMGHGIYLKTSELPDRLRVTHELVHVAQYERLGGISPFLRAYMIQIIRFGYFKAPLELEAVKVSERIVGD
jgi:hypothetical protein